MSPIWNGLDVVTPTEADSVLAEESGRKLAAHLGDPDGLRLELKAGGETEVLILPPSAWGLLARALAELGRGIAVTLMPLDAELTTRQAADLLNVSPAHLATLLDAGAIPGRVVGADRRFRLEDVLAYKRGFLARRRASLDRLAALSQDLDLGY